MRRVARRGAGEGWGRLLTAAVEKAAGGARLARGRSHVRAGQVLAIRIAPGLVIGEVQGSQNAPFTASVTVRVLERDAIDEVVGRVRGAPGVLAAVAGGTMPLELGELLLPAGASDVDFGCTCPDQGWPCRHAAALVTVLADRLEDDPTLLLTLRGIDLDTLIGGVDEAAGSAGDVDDWFGDRAELPALPRPAFVSAPQDLNSVHLRAALRALTPEEDAARRAARDLDDLYRGLSGE
ncbi:SWIM zinc finger family protein [Rhodococcus gannanensis]|uniref:SWIM zinc finger family protein n=1 Tax=Rhodococcus gannanensis TaxID=1960308 RepID=A0ABW4P6W8_9NOCA